MTLRYCHGAEHCKDLNVSIICFILRQEDLLDLITALLKFNCDFGTHSHNAVHIPKQFLMVH